MLLTWTDRSQTFYINGTYNGHNQCYLHGQTGLKPSVSMAHTMGTINANYRDKQVLSLQNQPISNYISLKMSPTPATY